MNPPQQQPPPGLTPQQRAQWNMFIDYLDKQGVKGSPLLDQRDKNLGQYYFQKFASTNPGLQITYNDVPRVQQELQDYRNNLVGQWKAGKVQGVDIKTEDDIMPGLSNVDGWLGSKTSSYRYPTASSTVTANGKTSKVDYGTNTEAFDAAHLKKDE
jgi:hypothetical protein